MRPGFGPFAAGGLTTTSVAAVAAFFLGGAAEQNSALTLAAGLCVGNVGAALWAAGPEERAIRPVAWARVGLLGAALSLVTFYAIIAPALHYALAPTEPTPGLYAAIALALAFALAIVWFSLRLVWRRAAPKDGAP